MDTYLKNHTGNMYTFVLLAFSGTFCFALPHTCQSHL
uniref:Uncharacterized protein n=1 Tax=Anguilla anguilla TaxID=7936 RepID=A0A0E9QNJ3_ANGAN